MSGRRGYSLVELLACLAIASTIFILASSLHMEALRSITRTGESARSPLQPLPARQIRLDVESARSVAGPSGEWTAAELELVGAGSGRVRFERLRGDLVRVDTDEAGTERRRTIARGVLSWRWKKTAPALVSVEITARSAPDPFSPLPPEGRKPKPAEPERMAIVVALRAADGRVGW